MVNNNNNNKIIFMRRCSGVAVVFLLVALLVEPSTQSSSLPTVVGTTSPPPPSDVFYSRWMEYLFPVIQNLTVLDLSLPGTHDTMTFDLSTTVSDHANDLPSDVAYILHEAHTELQWLRIGDFMRNQSKTQGLNLTEQLESGIRFVDFRTVYTAGPNATMSNATYDWYCLHFCESKSKAMVWFEAIKDFVVANPQEIVVVWISKHGDACGTKWNNLPHEILHAYWDQIQTLFGSLLFNHTQDRPLNETSIATLLARGQRVVVYASDYDNFTTTSGRDVANNACLLDNEFSSSASNATSTIVASRIAFQSAANHIANESKPLNRFYLLSMATDPIARLEDSTMIEYFWVLLNQTNESRKCANYYHIPGMNSWCPMHLQSDSQLTNYYNQIPLYEVALCIDAGTGKPFHQVSEGVNPFDCPVSLPNAIYLDALDVNGTIRTGTTLYGPGYPDGWTNAEGFDGHGMASYGYVDTFVIVNLRRGCVKVTDPLQVAVCQKMLADAMERWSSHGLRRWNDPEHGRLMSWPQV